MVRFLFSMFFYVVVARWVYSELRIVAPRLSPVIDYALERVQIPTHDHWNPETVDHIVGGVTETANAVLAHASHENGHEPQGHVTPVSATAPGGIESTALHVREALGRF